jgi:hypothetical protein
MTQVVSTENMIRQREGLTKDAEKLRAEIGQAEISQEARDRIRETVREVRGKIDHATFAQKRFLINKLEVEIVVREDEAGRWLDVSWGLSETTDFDKVLLTTTFLSIPEMGNFLISGMEPGRDWLSARSRGGKCDRHR